ncbi:MAG: hypothetical protein AAF702_41215 [Chloroflexota bacterium]
MSTSPRQRGTPRVRFSLGVQECVALFNWGWALGSFSEQCDALDWLTFSSRNPKAPYPYHLIEEINETWYNVNMSSKPSILDSPSNKASKFSGKQPYFQAKYLWLSAGISLVLWIAWVATLPGLGLTMTTQPLYFPEAPYWHVGLHMFAMATTGYTTVGLTCMWLDGSSQSKNA